MTWQVFQVNQAARAMQKNQRPACVWFTGLSGAGKTTLANLLEQQLWLDGRHTYLLDGDVVRLGLNKDLGFSEADRHESVRRVAEMARCMVDAGLIVLVAMISPFQADRDFARSIMGERKFIEVYVNTPIDVCAERDPKALYARAEAGLVPHFTGVSSPYEPPLDPDIVVSTANNADGYHLIKPILKKLELQ